MREVIIITLMAGFSIFGLGIVSALKNRRQQEIKSKSARAARSQHAATTVPPRDNSSAMGMAAHGTSNGNGRDEFATVGNHSR